MWVLVASDLAFDKPCLRVFQISCWKCLIVRASLTNSGSRERRAQVLSVVDTADDGVVGVADVLDVKQPRPMLWGGAVVGGLTSWSAR